MGVVVQLQRTGFQRLSHASGDEPVGFLLHVATFLGETYNLLTLVLFALLAGDKALLLHALE